MGIFGEVGPLVGVLLHVVEFLAAVGIADVAPVVGADGVIALIVGGDGGPLAGCAGILELGHEAVAFEVGARGHLGEREQRGKNVEQLHRAVAHLPSFDAWPRKDERHLRAAFPEGVFASDELFAEMPAVVAPEDDDGVVQATGGFELAHEASHLAVHETHAGEVGAHQGPPFVEFAQRAQAWLGELPVQKIGKLRQVIAVILFDRWHLERSIGIEIKPLLRGVARDMWQAETRSDEEGFVRRRALQRINGGVGDLPVGVVFVFLGEDAPVHQWMPVWAGEIGNGCLRLRHGPAIAPFIELHLLIFPTQRAIVIDLPTVESEVTCLREGLRQRHMLLRLLHFANARSQAIDASARRTQAGEQRTARRIAQRCLTMRASKQSAALGQRINRRRLHLRMPTHAANPIVLIIDGDEEDVGPRVSGVEGEGEEECEAETEQLHGRLQTKLN